MEYVELRKEEDRIWKARKELKEECRSLIQKGISEAVQKITKGTIVVPRFNDMVEELSSNATEQIFNMADSFGCSN